MDADVSGGEVDTAVVGCVAAGTGVDAPGEDGVAAEAGDIPATGDDVDAGTGTAAGTDDGGVAIAASPAVAVAAALGGGEAPAVVTVVTHSSLSSSSKNNELRKSRNVYSSSSSDWKIKNCIS